MTSLTTLVKDQAATIGEAMNIGYIIKKSGQAYAYNHMGNTLASAIFYEGTDENVAKDCALQVAAMAPEFVSVNDVSGDRISKLKAEFEADESLANKPEAIRAQIVEGKIQKSLQDDILLEQVSIKDPSKKIKEILPQ